MHLCAIPQSRGRLWLQSSSPDDPPYIDPKYYSHPQDIQTMIKAIKLILEIIENSPELKKFGFELPAEPVLPMCQNKSSTHSEHFFIVKPNSFYIFVKNIGKVDDSGLRCYNLQT